MNKKAYYFSIEATLGILVLATSFFVLLYFTESAVPVPEYRYAENVAGYLSHVTLGELCSDGCEGYDYLTAEPALYNSTLMDFIGYKYSQSLGNATTAVNETVIKAELLLRGKEVAFTIKGIACDILYSTGEISCEEGTNETTEIVYRKIIQGYVVDEDSGDIDFWGDYIFEVRVW